MEDVFQRMMRIINGVNRHEWNAKSGRCVSENDEIYDIECMKRNNINAVRTCHYPDRITWYYRCDEAGIYVMAEVNLESHGSWQKMGAVEPSWNVHLCDGRGESGKSRILAEDGSG